MTSSNPEQQALSRNSPVSVFQAQPALSPPTGFNYATAFEWALKWKELTYVIAEPYSSAHFQHGPIAMVEGGFPIFAIAPNGAVQESMRDMLTRLRKQKDAEPVVISDDEQALALAQSPIPLPPRIPEWLTPLVGIIPAQLFACHLTHVKGYVPKHHARSPR